jgi:transposase
MMQLSPHMRILVAIESVDFRAGIDGLCRISRQVLETDPLGGAVLVFRNRRGTSIKLLAYDGQGFWLCQKRMSAGKFRFWPTANGRVQRELFAHELAVLLQGGDPEAVHTAPAWRPLERVGAL